ncbi:MAG: decarboxylating 6-phosphogluconate dehydrogenase [Nitrosomonadales bacterium]|jgi:6-phosphogluconate dehydrogenase|uniref:6-phosphogluconate dehydrogenase-like protein n=1 Tax=Methylophilales bacterium HTCC2181 TaxID=383631 RepID=A0P6D5_9PROT|nr:6-phosphogluconate dehydrogenase-like protein [Methylophilales bacterium HTCC2181]MBT3513118.1 decarboxylating 6-phosphogluconate dehydrogenase [Nitrosomonadales bacterium]MBT5410959.1 decarboxylating 6-phosphogluconate dehydrogenase [Nitrosomonadales bacterium]|tara:strand:+ start:325 stop:1239 length:915 start_codon:yes stop_codon:yes gene_type:complete
MKIAMLGLGKMGGNMAARLIRNGVSVVGYDNNQTVVNQLEETENLIPASSVKDALSKLDEQKIVWMMLPAGEITENQIHELVPLLNKGDVIIDGGNSNFKRSVKMGAMLEENGIGFMDCGTSGGVWGLDNGYCLMVGANDEVAKVVEPALRALAVTPQNGWLHVGPVGSGHFTKMIHNGIEYGMMESFAEGLELLKGREEFKIDVAQVTELWRHGSVVRSWLLDLTAEALKNDPTLDDIAPFVPDSGEGRWTVVESIEQGIPTPVLTLALQVRFRSQEKQKGYGYKLLSTMRNAFGGHVMKKRG